MATQKLHHAVLLSQVVPAASPLLVPDRAVAPASFVEALKQGWKFDHESTCLSIDKRHRDGTVTLIRPGSSKLFVPYTASVKRGYSFGKPRLA
jgi:hypothetical protein